MRRVENTTEERIFLSIVSELTFSYLSLYIYRCNVSIAFTLYGNAVGS